MRGPVSFTVGLIAQARVTVYRGAMEDVEARARLSSVLDVCEHEGQALEALSDARLAGVLQAMSTLRAEIVAALAALTPNARKARVARKRVA